MHILYAVVQMQTCILETNLHAHTHTNACMHPCTCMHTHTFTYTHTCIHTLSLTHLHPFIHSQSHLKSKIHILQTPFPCLLGLLLSHLPQSWIISALKHLCGHNLDPICCVLACLQALKDVIGVTVWKDVSKVADIILQGTITKTWHYCTFWGSVCRCWYSRIWRW